MQEREFDIHHDSSMKFHHTSAGFGECSDNRGFYLTTGKELHELIQFLWWNCKRHAFL